MPTLAAYATMMERDRKREGLRVCRAAWLLSVSVREYREIVSGDRMLSLDTYRRIPELYGWPEAFVESRGDRYGSLETYRRISDCMSGRRRS